MKALVTGLKDNGKQGIAAITQENHLEIALHDPLLPFDNAATTCTFTGNNQIVWSGTLGDTGELFLTFSDEVTLQPGESYTLAAKSSTGTPSYVVGSINTREEQ